MSLISSILVTSNTIVTGDATLYLIDASGNNVTLTLPDEAIDGSNFIFLRIDNSANEVQILPGTSQTINGLASANLFFNYKTTLVYLSSETNWYEVSGNQQDGVAGNLSEFIRLSSGLTLLSTGTLFVGTYGNTATESMAQILIARDCVVSDVSIALADAPGLGNSRTFTLNQGVPGGSPSTTGLVVTISDTDLTGNQSGPVSLNAGDLISIQSDTSGATPDTTALVNIKIN